MSAPRAEAPAPPRGDPNTLITAVASAATAAVVLTAAGAWDHAQSKPTQLLIFVGLTIALQLVNVEVYNRGAMSFAGTGLLALGFSFGPGPAILAGIVMGVTTLIARRGRLNRGVFDSAQFGLAAGAGALCFQAFSIADAAVATIAGAFLAGIVYMLVNVGLLCWAMSLAEQRPVKELWSERFRWTTPYYLASGPLALALTVAYVEVGITGLLAFTLPPLLMMFGVRQYVARTRESVEAVRQANADLQAANAELALRNADLHALFEFAGGLGARSHDRTALVTYGESAVAKLTGGVPRIHIGPEGYGIPLVSGGTRVGGLELAGHGLDPHRWERLQDAILPQLATALESAELIEQVRKTHLATIAALSRSMEAKDYYTGGHTERVSDLAVALAKRLGYSGSELDALEIGALLHDIGKIGIPERILHKPETLDEDEWKVMKEHPIISEYILSGVDLPEIVLHIARHSHESFDGSGYPDGLAGEAIPLPARIVLVADAFDALTSDRPYRRGRHVRAAMDEIREHVGMQFCPRVVEALEAVYREEPHLLGAGGLRAVEVA